MPLPNPVRVYSLYCNMKIIKAPSSLKIEINQFYHKVGYHSHWSGNEQAYCMLDNNLIIGAVKIEELDDFFVLRGMYLDNNFHQRGLGTQLLKFIEPILNKAISYCLPFNHLTPFYQQVNFEVIQVEQLPLILMNRFEKYRNEGHQIIPMYKPSKSLFN